MWCFLYIILVVIGKTVDASYQSFDRLLLKNEVELDKNFSNFIIDVALKYNFKTLFIKEAIENTCPKQELLKQWQQALLVQTWNSHIKLKTLFNTNMLIIACLKSVHTDLQPLLYSLEYMRDTKVVFYIAASWHEDYIELLTAFFEYAYAQRMLNIFVIFEDFASKRYYYSYAPFPQFTLEMREISEEANYFPERFNNLHGHKVLTLPDQLEPRSLVYADKHGKQLLRGYVGNFVRTLIWKLNGTLTYLHPVKTGQQLHYSHLQQLAHNGTLNIPISVVPLFTGADLRNATYPLESLRSCVMIPLADDIPLYKVYLHIFSVGICIIAVTTLYTFTWLIMLLKYQRNQVTTAQKLYLNPIDFILNDLSLRGIIGQPFMALNKPNFKLKLVYLLLCITGLYLTCIFQAQLQTLLTQPPKELQITTMKQAYDANLHIVIAEQDAKFFQKYSSNANALQMHMVSKSFSEFRRLRNSLNTKYAYPVGNNGWQVYEQQQKYFARKLFILPETACVMGVSYNGFALEQNSLYRTALEQFILAAQANGLIDHWSRLKYYEMVESGRLKPFEDLSNPKIYGGPLIFEDLQWIWLCFTILMLSSCIIFIFELCIKKFITQNIA